MNKLMAEVPKSARNNVSQSLPDELGHLDIKSTQKLVLDRFW